MLSIGFNFYINKNYIMKRKTIGELMPTGLGLDYSPVNEQGVVFLFAKYHKQLGIEALQSIQDFFPDAIARIKVGKDRFTEKGIEFEFKSSGFKDHIKNNQYNGKNCEIIVCWEHDWKDCPKELEIIELKTKIPELLEKGKLPKIKVFSEKQKKYLEFFNELLDRFKIRLPNVTRQKALPQSWCSIPIGISGIHLEWQIYQRPCTSLSVSLDMERNEKDNKELFEYFKNKEENLKKELGSDLHFLYPWGRKVKWARIYKKRAYDPQNEKELEQIKKWGLETMIKFYNVFKPHFDKLKVSILSN